MPHFDTKEFGEAAPYLRKSDLELLTSRTIAFDGRVLRVLKGVLNCGSYCWLFNFHFQSNVTHRPNYSRS